MMNTAVPTRPEPRAATKMDGHEHDMARQR